MAIVWKEVGREPVITEQGFSAKIINNNPVGMSVTIKDYEPLERDGYVLSEIYVEVTGINTSSTTPIILEKLIEEHRVIISANPGVSYLEGIVYGVFR